MTKNLYQKVVPISREDAEAAFSSESPDRIGDALVSVAFYDPDWQWVQEKCLHFIGSPNADIRGLAVTCLGHLARIHKKLDLKKVLPILKNLRSDTEVSGKVEDAFDDIETFVAN